MNKLTYSGTLAYYDRPQIIEAVDAIGGRHIAVLLDTALGDDEFLVVGVAPEQLREFRIGKIDLLNLILGRPNPEWYIGKLVDGSENEFDIKRQTGDLSDTGYLPDADYYLHPASLSIETLTEARNRNNLVMELAVEPPESVTEHKIRITTFAMLLSEIQSLVKHAYKRALREVPTSTKKSMSIEDGALFDIIVPASPGSFKVILEASQKPDLVGQSELSRAMKQIDMLFESAGSPQDNLEVVKQNKGHFAGAYIRLLRLLMENDTNLRYSWAEPSDVDTHTYSVAKSQATMLVKLFDNQVNLETEEITVIGELSKADNKSGTWRLETEDGRVYGKTKSNGPNLNGLSIGMTYEFKCMEKLVINERGKEQRTLYLLEFNQAK